MYWYYKYPLLILGAAALVGMLYLGWRQLPPHLFSRLFHSAQKAGEGAESAASPTSPAPTPSETTGGTSRAAPPPAGTSARPPSPPAGSGAAADEVRRRLEAAKAQLAGEHLLAARTLARKVLHAPGVAPFSDLWMEAARIISQVNTTFINSDAPCPEKVDYIIQEGDTLSRIARRFNTTIEAIQRCNKLDQTNPVIYPGHVLHIYTGDWHIVVKRNRCLLLLYDGNELFKLYVVGIGRQDRTPLGVFRIKNKIRHPAWTPPGKNIPYGDPRNVLGTRWMGLEPIEGTNPNLLGYGIHGTWEPDSVGKAVSQGCIRMRNQDVEELFDIVPVGTRVVIEDD